MSAALWGSSGRVARFQVLSWDTSIVDLGSSRDDGKESGSYYNGLYRV